MDNIGILDPSGKNNNPFTDAPYSDRYKELAKLWSQLPVYEKAQELIDTIRNHQVVLLIAGTGSGKSVIIPKLTAHAFDYKGHVVMTLPKQIIAKSAAEFASATLDVELGSFVGYQYKGSEKRGKSDKTQLLYATDGTIVARLLKDPVLREFDAVIVDEAHERKVQIDFLLYLLRNVLAIRPEFKIIIMSATVNEDIFTSYFSEYKFISLNISGKPNFPIESIFTTKPIGPNDYLERGMEIIKFILKTDDQNKKGAHDILFFVTSVNETIEICDKLRESYNDVFPIEVYAGMKADDQELAQNKDLYRTKTGKKRKIVVATNVAESSLTIDGIKFVIDSGYELFSYYDPDRRAKILKRKLITNAQARQRMGRSGRTEPGVCYHLYTKDDFDNKMKRFPEPNIRLSNIYAECLRLLNIPQIETLDNLISVLNNFIEPPAKEYIDSAITQLLQLGLINNERITSLGKLVADLQADPEAGLTLYASYQLNCMKEVVAILAVIDASKNSMSELFRLPQNIINDESDDKDRYKYLHDKYKTAKKSLMHRYGDHLSIMKLFYKFLSKSKNNDKLNDWLYKHFLKLTTLEKAKTYFRKGVGKAMSAFKDIKKDIADIMEYDIDYRVMTAFYFGYKNNIGYYKEKDRAYNTNYAKRVQINKESFMTMHEKPKKLVLYHELFASEMRTDMNIVSMIPKKSEVLYEKLQEHMNNRFGDE